MSNMHTKPFEEIEIPMNIREEIAEIKWQLINADVITEDQWNQCYDALVNQDY